MDTEQPLQTPMDISTSRQQSIKYQLDILKLEIETIAGIVARIDEITQTTKNWAIVTWTGSIALALGSTDLRKFLIFTAILPLTFWYVDAHWRHLQKRSIFRTIKIREFLNDGRLAKSFEQQNLVDFIVYDLVGQQYKDTSEYKRETSFWGAISFTEVRTFYLVLCFISVALGIFFLR